MLGLDPQVFYVPAMLFEILLQLCTLWKISYDLWIKYMTVLWFLTANFDRCFRSYLYVIMNFVVVNLPNKRRCVNSGGSKIFENMISCLLSPPSRFTSMSCWKTASKRRKVRKVYAINETNFTQWRLSIFLCVPMKLRIFCHPTWGYFLPLFW